jgi:hypothetical protein
MNAAVTPLVSTADLPNTDAAENLISHVSCGQSRKREEYMTFQSVNLDVIMKTLNSDVD